MTRLGAGAGSLAFLSVVPRPATADTIQLPRRESQILRDIFGSDVLTDGKVGLEMPSIAETGLSVPITFQVDSPMTEADHVTRIMAFAPANPEPILADYEIGPRVGVAKVTTRIRLAKTQTVYAAAKLSDGTLWGTRVAIIVTLGACIEDVFVEDWERDDARRIKRAEAYAAEAAAAAAAAN